MANFFTNTLQNIKNIFYVPVGDAAGKPFNTKDQQTYVRNMGGSDDADKNLSNIMAPIAINRIKQDKQQWRMAIQEAERPILPYRYLMQQMYLDTILDPQICAAVERRKNLTLLRDFKLVDESGTENVEWSNYLRKKWFHEFMSYSLDAIFYGYSLISLGDIVNNEFPGVTLIRRGNISPDRTNVAPVPYNPLGANFLEEPYCDFHIWVKTPNEHGMSNCGYGLFYTLTPLAIDSKNNTTYNAQSNELFGMPFRVLKSDKKDEEERRTAANALDNMGSKGWIMINTEDELEFLEGSKGRGYMAFDTFQTQIDKRISKILLGHSDGLDSAGKSANQNSSSGVSGSPQEKALGHIQTKDGTFLEPIINNQLLPIIRKHGIDLPENLRFVWNKDAEEVDAKSVINNEMIKISTAAANFAKAGLQIETASIEFLLNGIKFKEIDTPAESAEEVARIKTSAVKVNPSTDKKEVE